MSQIILLNKPFNVLCQFRDTEGRATLADFVDTARYPKFYPAGRLDYDSEGLLLLTNDGALQHQISHPSQKLEKTYWAQVEGEPTDEDLEPLINGIQLKDGLTRPAKASIIAAPSIWLREPPIRVRKDKPTSWIELSISEGKNRQVRRMTAAIGFPTLRLIRVSIGPWSIKGLDLGTMKVEQVSMPNAPKTSRAHSRPKPRSKPQSKHRTKTSGQSRAKRR